MSVHYLGMRYIFININQTIHRIFFVPVAMKLPLRRRAVALGRIMIMIIMRVQQILLGMETDIIHRVLGKFLIS